MNEILLPIILAAVTSTGLFTFIQFLISRKDSVKKELAELHKEIHKCECDNCRTQMLILMQHYPTETSELMKVAQHYFEDLKGDWYFTGIFAKYLEENHLPIPKWFNSKE